MNKISQLKHLLLLAVAAIALNSCGDANTNGGTPDGEKIELTVRAITEEVTDFSSFNVILSAERTGKKTEQKLNKEGKTTLKVDRGRYGIEINGTQNGKEYAGSIAMDEYGSNTTIPVTLTHIVAAYKGAKAGLVLKEIFYNGGTYNGTMQHPDQYVVIANNSDKDIAVDGVVIAVTANMNTYPNETLTAFLPDEIVVTNMYQFPGSGSEYVLKPGGEYVVAVSAVDHREVLTSGPRGKFAEDTGIPVNLSGANFEFADPDAKLDGKITDNPNVPNMIKISNDLPGGVTAWLHPFAIRPIFIFDGTGINWDTYRSSNRVTYKGKQRTTQEEVEEYQGYKVPTALVIDGVETTSATTPFWGNYTGKSLPVTVDKGYVQGTTTPNQGTGPACHHSIFMFRKKDKATGKLIDTNNSANDMQIEHRAAFKGYPAK